MSGDYPDEMDEFDLMYDEEMGLMEDAESENNQNAKLVESQPGCSSAHTLLPCSTVESQSSSTETPHAAKISSTPFSVSSLDPLAELQNIGASSRKRRLEDLFGDINDIEEELSGNENEYGTKKVKTEREQNAAIIETILEARRQYQEKLNPLNNGVWNRKELLHKFKMQNLSYTVPKWPFIVLQRSDKSRIYVRMHSEEFETNQIAEVTFAGRSFNGLLGERRAEIWESARELVVKALTPNDQPRNELAAPAMPLLNKDLQVNLWVEKYRPKKYIDLLSDESTNRSLLQWMKMWDKVVFGKEIKEIGDKGATTKLNSFDRKTGRFQSTGGWKRKGKSSLNTNRDEIGRPIQKVALLCGPPGLGKTTLAHTIAKHAGYAIREMNASDDRNLDAFKVALENGTQMSSMLNPDKRPNCIILDEIDGAPTASIDFLVKFISDSVVEKVTKKGGKEKKFLIKRPIICICNDLYVPALRQLRQVAFVVNFPKLNVSRLADRLLQISCKQNIDTDMTCMLALAEKTGNDVRACLSVLQFQSCLKKPLTLSDVMRANIGQKDRQKGYFGVWSSIFQIQRPRRCTLENDNSDKPDLEEVRMSDMSATTRMKHVLDVVHRGGDYERLMQGVYENYLTQRMPDPNMLGITEALDWFIFSDRLQSTINHSQNYTVYGYLQFGFVAWHFLFAGMAWPKLNYPNKSYEAMQKSNTHRMLFQALRRGIACTVQGIGCGASILYDTMPLVKWILCPTLRSVSVQLLSARERSDLKHAVDVMNDFGITYVQTKAVDGTYHYAMEPDLQMLCEFPDIGSAVLSYWGKQLIAREVNIEKMRRAMPKIVMATAAADGQQKQTIAVTSENGVKERTSEAAGSTVPNHLIRLQPKSAKRKNHKDCVAAKDFFGRLIKAAVPTASQEQAIAEDHSKNLVWFRFKEGYCDAVRRNVYTSELL